MEIFRLSPSLNSVKRRCGHKFKLVYGERLKRKKEKHILLKGRVVHRVMQILLHQPEKFKSMQALAMQLLDEYVGKGEGNTYERAHDKYEFPTPNQKQAYFTWDDFALQIITSVEILWAYVQMMGLKPMMFKEQVMIEYGAQFEVEGDPAKPCKNILDLVGVDKNGEIAIVDWKLGMRKYTMKNGMSEADGNNNVVSYALAMHKADPDTFSPPVCVRIIRAVVTKKGKASESTDAFKTTGIAGLDLYERHVTLEEMQEEYDNQVADLDDINNDRLRKNKQFDCPTMCDMAEVCLKGDMKPYERKPEYKPTDAFKTTGIAGLDLAGEG